MRREVHAVTGAFGYSGLHLSRLLLERGEAVCSLTGHPDRPDPFGGRVEVRRFQFEDPARMRAALADVKVLYNTYWVRFAHGTTTHARAVGHSRSLFQAAAEAGVERVVHVSITNPSLDSPLPYFKGKAEVEQALAATGLSHAILRPAVFFGGRDVLINNIAWLLRRLPVFGIAPGRYGLQPIHVEDMARLSAEQGASRTNVTLDAVGPEALGFDELVHLVRRAVGSRALVTTVPPWFLLLASRLLQAVVGDVVLTSDEVVGLTSNLLVSSGPATGTTRFSDWLGQNAAGLGVAWASELDRHFKPSQAAEA
ncbi:MAG: NAD(P)H-binding protein [Anaeromyxobacter sp.]|nr:NAD(P)H-binding protein [Anaeromyxobacter sp.]MBL0277714.1 NAD(P)H-binding protein [Anaeromyxobacter sp.]